MWLLGLITDIVLYFLLVMVELGIFIWGGGFGGAIFIVVNNLSFYWFPLKRTIGDILFKREKTYQVKEKVSLQNLKWQLSLSKNPSMRKGQIFAIALSIVSLVYGIYTLKFGVVRQLQDFEIGRINLDHPNIMHFWNVEIALYFLHMLGQSISLKEEYSKRKQEKIQRNLYAWSPMKYKGINHCMADQYLGKWRTYDSFNEKIRTGSYVLGYRFYERYEWESNEFIDTYLREYKGNIALDVVLLIRVPEVKRKHVDIADEYFNSFIRSYFQEEEWKAVISLTFVLCVDKVSDVYREMIDTQIQEVHERYVLPAGIVFPNGNLCLATFWRNKDFEADIVASCLLSFLYKY